MIDVPESKVVWKFQLHHQEARGGVGIETAEFKIQMPHDAEFRLFGYDHKIGELCVWYEISFSNKNKLETRTLYVAGTGASHYHDNWIASCFAPAGFIFHLYEGPIYRSGNGS